MNGWQRVLWLAGWLAAVGAAVAEPVWPDRIVVITDGRQPVTGRAAIVGSTVVEVYDLDAPTRLQTELSTGLPADPAAAERAAKRRLTEIDSAALRARFSHAYGGLIRALSFGIDRYPAMIFDDRSVVYGVTDLEAALTHYRRWRRLAAQAPVGRERDDGIGSGW